MTEFAKTNAEAAYRIRTVKISPDGVRYVLERWVPPSTMRFWYGTKVPGHWVWISQHDNRQDAVYHLAQIAQYPHDAGMPEEFDAQGRVIVGDY